MIPIPSSTFNNPIFTGLKPITKTVTVSNVSGSYSQVFSDDRIIAHMAVTKVEVADPSIFHGRLGFTPAAGQVTVYCSEVVGETTVKMFFEKTADDPTAVSSTEFDMLANRIGDLTNLTTTAKENVVAALNEVDSKLTTETISTGITGVTAKKTGNVVQLTIENSQSVSAGGYTLLGSLPSALRPVGGTIFGVATDGYTGGRHMCTICAQTNGDLYYASDVAMSPMYASLCYVVAS